jgi:hypothetical protein
MKKTLFALFSATILVLGLQRASSAALVSVGGNVLSDGVLEYLTMEEVGELNLVALELKLAGPIAGREGWRLGTRQEFYNMVRRGLTRPLADYVFNDAFFSDGTIRFGDPDVDASLNDPTLDQVRSGDPSLAIELRDIILLFEEPGTDPAYLLFGLGTSDTDGAGRRYTTGIGAYYNSSDGTSIARNNTIRGPASSLDRSFAADAINQRWFVVRAVPEPTSVILMLLGGLFLVNTRRPRGSHVTMTNLRTS